MDAIHKDRRHCNGSHLPCLSELLHVRCDHHGKIIKLKHTAGMVPSICQGKEARILAPVQIEFNAVRPITAIRYLYGTQNISAWGGPYKGTQVLTGKEYRSYIKTMQHADYPSGSACYCAAWTNAVRGALGTDQFGYSITFPAGLDCRPKSATTWHRSQARRKSSHLSTSRGRLVKVLTKTSYCILPVDGVLHTLMSMAYCMQGCPCLSPTSSPHKTLRCSGRPSQITSKFLL